MAEVLTVLFKIGHLPSMTKPEPAVIENALKKFLHETVSASALGKELSIPPDTEVKYEVRWDSEIVEDAGTLPIHLSIRGPQHIAEPLHDKLRFGLAEGRWNLDRAQLSAFANDLGIAQGVPTEFKIYVRSPTGEKF